MLKEKDDIFRQNEYVNYYDYKKYPLAGAHEARKKKMRRKFYASLVIFGLIIGVLHGDIGDEQMKKFFMKSLREDDILAQSTVWAEKGVELLYNEAVPALANGKNTENSARASLPLAGRVVSSFGWQKAEEKFNKGIVLETDEVSAVKAAYDGTVEEIYKDGGYYTIVLTHEGGLKSVYGGCASIVVKGNMRVKKGDIIGYSGVYQVEKSRIYFEITHFGEPVDPLSAVSEKQV